MIMINQSYTHFTQLLLGEYFAKSVRISGNHMSHAPQNKSI